MATQQTEYKHSCQTTVQNETASLPSAVKYRHQTQKHLTTASHWHKQHNDNRLPTTEVHSQIKERQNCTNLVSTANPLSPGWKTYASDRYRRLRESWMAPSWCFHTDSEIRVSTYHCHKLYSNWKYSSHKFHKITYSSMVAEHNYSIAGC